MIVTENKVSKLSDILTGKTVVIARVLGHGGFRKRITEMGFVRGKQIKVIRNAPLKDPIEYEIMGYNVSLRRSEAEMIEVITTEDAVNIIPIPFEGTSFNSEIQIHGFTGRAVSTKSSE